MKKGGLGNIFMVRRVCLGGYDADVVGFYPTRDKALTAVYNYLLDNGKMDESYTEITETSAKITMSNTCGSVYYRISKERFGGKLGE